MNEQVQEIFVEDIIPNRFQPRLTFDEKALQELADSIKVHGVIQPLVLRKVGNKYEIIAGERRYKASCLAGLKRVPAVVREMNDNESAEVALIENVQRKNLSSIEEAQSYKNLLDRDYMTQEELAAKLGVAQSTIANKLRLLNLCDEVQNALLNEQISERHARSLLQLSNPDDQKNMLDRIIKERLTVKQLDVEIKKKLNGDVKTELIAEPENDGGNPMNFDNTMLNNDNNTEDGNNSGTAPTKNIFGFQVPTPTDLETSAPNLSTGIEDSTPPITFNPFSGDMNFGPANFSETSMQTDNNTNATTSEEPLETFDMFGDIIPSTSEEEPLINPFNDEEKGSASPVANIGDQINNVRDVIDQIEKSGFRVEKEEYDFEDMYQITIKIKKQN